MIFLLIRKGPMVKKTLCEQIILRLLGFFFCFLKRNISRNGIFKKEQKERYVIPTALEFCSHFHGALWHWAGKASAGDWHITM